MLTQKQTILAFFTAMLFAIGGLVQPVQAQLSIDVTRGVVRAMPIAVPHFSAGSTEASGRSNIENQVSQKMAKVIRANLASSGLFAPVDPKRYLDQAPSVATAPRFDDWRLTDAQTLLVGQVSLDDRDDITVDFRLWDVLARNQMVGRRLTTPRENWRQLAHMISDAIYARVTGEAGYFNTRIVYIAEKGAPNKRIKRLAIMDQDGANHRYLTDGRHLVLTPRFSPNQQMITYMSYEGREPAVYIYDLNTGRRRLLGNFPGMSFAPRFSPDGKSVVMSISRRGNTDIYTMDIGGRNLQRLTNSPSIETAPSFSPDGQYIAFESDRSGGQQLYVMRSNGQDVRRITFGKGRYANPVWSPRGDLIAFTRMYKGKFYVGVIRPDGSGERLIAEAYHVEGPTWSPNGRVLMYFKETPTGNRRQGRAAHIYSIDITGGNERRRKTPVFASDPAWSPPLSQMK